MKLISFSTGGSAARIGLVVNDGVIDVAKHIAGAPTDMIALMG